MVFSSTIFIFLFLPITLFIYYFIKEAFRNYWLLFVSLLFFAWSQPNYLWIILLNISVNYIAALLMQCTKIKKIVFIICLLANLGLLVYFKYFNFIVDSINNLFHKSFNLDEIVLPIGISFFTFQGLSYAIDVYRKQAMVQKNPFKVALYIVLFPQLIAGPIVRYTDIVKEINSRTIDIDDFSYGIQRFIIGMGKKAIIASTMAVVADSIWNKGIGNSIASVAWLGSVTYTLQIYYDFSGYSDMAVGLGRMFGFHFNENFDSPYISKSISEFWRRWHISLSTWFRDYVYIPLGGNQKNVYINLAVVFLLTGIWHGASWSFVIWGIWNGFFVILERAIKSKRNTKAMNKQIGGVFYTLFIVNIGWVLFRAGTLNNAVLYLRSMFMINQRITGYTLLSYLDRWTMFIFVCGIFFASSLPKRGCKILYSKLNRKAITVFRYLFLICIFCFSILRIVSGTYNPFIYFQF